MGRTIESILVPTDGSEGAEAGVRRGIDLAATTGADLHVLSVVDVREVEPPLSLLDAENRTEREELFEDEAERAVDVAARLARTHLPGSVTTAVKRGVPSRTITDYADAYGVDLVVMGTHGRTGLERALLGSVAERTIRTAGVPVVTVPPGANVVELGDVSYEDILLPTDGSEGAATAVDWGVGLAAVYDATVHTVYSVETGRFAGVGSSTEIHDALERVGRDALEAVRDRARAADVEVTGHLGSGPAARVILSYCESHDVDLIVMGTHGRSGAKRYLIGSVTETVVRNADVPVCCVPMEEL
jgi:nucleotide-binding universal stress UspA family protein